MTRMKTFTPIACLLCVIVCGMNAALITPDSDTAAVRREAPATFGNGALHFRLMQLTDRFGRIPIDAYTRAKQHVDTMKARAQARKAAREMAAMAPSAAAPASSLTTSSAALVQSSADGAIHRGAWRWLGPGNIGGRIRSLVIDPANPDVMLAGSVGGGIWKTMNGGVNWFAVDDFMAVLSVSSMVMDPTNPGVIYAGTGEGYNNGDAIRGAGIFKSTDGGNTWIQLAATANDAAFWAVNRVALSPDGKILLAGTASGTYRSTNGGASFAQIASGIPSQDVVFDPASSQRAIAAGWGSIASTRDGGLTWQIAGGLPSTANGRIEVAYARSASNVIYASVDDEGGSIYRSNDGGATFAFVSAGDLLENQGWYDNAIWVNPKNSNDLIVGGVLLHHSLDGGHTWRTLSGVHVDQHVIVESPGYDDVKNRTLFVANDGGVYKTSDIRPASGDPAFTALNNDLGVTQFYSGAASPIGVIVGGAQDNGTLVYKPASGTTWSQALGSDGGTTAADPADSSYLYSETIYLSLYRSVSGGAGFAPIAQGIADAGSNANFIAPFVLDPNNANRMLAGGASLWRTNTLKASTPAWSAISGASTDYISAIAVAPGNSDLVWVGRSFGRVYRTSNGTSSSPVFTAMKVPTNANFITHITISPFDANVVYVTTGSFAASDIVKTIDGGLTWTDATGSGATALPEAPVHDLAIDPEHPDTIYAATEVGVFVSDDGGGSWELPQDGPANVCVDQLFWMGTTLVAVTHGRGMFAVETSAAGAPAITLTPTHVDFGTQAIGSTTAAKTITIANSGTAALHVRAVSLSGSESGAFSLTAGTCTGATIAPGATCTAQVAFHPTATGTQSILVSVTSDATPTAESIPVSGVGSAAIPAGGPLPAPWASKDIGAVGAAGTASSSNGQYVLAGGGADIWGTADAFRFAYQTLPGDGVVIARVASVQNVAAWTKAGLMIRQSLDASAAHAAIYVTPGKGVAFQYRTASGGSTSYVGTSGTAPRWIKLARSGAIVTASTSLDGSAWSTVGQTTIASLPATTYVGLVISSHDATRLATATFDSVSIATSAALPAGWETADIGDVGVAGKATESGGIFTVKGAGDDIWGTADAFRYVYRALPGDGFIAARVATVQYVRAWTKAGVMIRQSLDADSAHASMFVSAAKGLAFQRRLSRGGLSVNTGLAGAAPRWVKVARAGSVVTAYTSADGATWTKVGQDTLAISGAVWVGLAVTSHDATTRATVTFDHVTP
jgi:hypothetical protein